MIKVVSALAMAATLALAAPAAMAADTSTVPAVTSADRSLGRADAPVTVIEYASFTCTHCAAWHNDVLAPFKARYIDTGQVRLVFRDLPTNPVQVAATAAAIGRCSAPDKFFDVARHFMSTQSSSFASGDLRGWFEGAIKLSGKTNDEIDACLALPATEAALTTDIQAAAASGVTGTPSFFVNGTRTADHSLAALSAAIDPLLRDR